MHSFLRNMHPVLATCLSHRLHPVSKAKRFFVYYMLVSLHMTFSVLSAEAVTCRQSFECSLDPVDAERWCCSVQALGLIELRASYGVYVLSLFFAVATVVFGQLWFLVAACDCCQHQRASGRARWELFAKAILGFWGICMTVLLGYCVYYLTVNPALAVPAIESFALMKSISFVGAFVFQSIVFYKLWHDQTYHAAKYVDRFQLTYEDWDGFRQRHNRPSLSFKPANSVLFSSSAPPEFARKLPQLPIVRTSTRCAWAGWACGRGHQCASQAHAAPPPPPSARRATQGTGRRAGRGARRRQGGERAVQAAAPGARADA